MSIFGVVLKAAGAVNDFDDPRKWSGWIGGGARTSVGKAVTDESALGLSSYMAALRAISEDVAKLPLKVYRRLKRGREENAEHPIYRLLHTRPNPTMTSISFRELLQQWGMAWGDGYAQIERQGDGLATALWPIHPSRVTPKIAGPDGRGLVYEVRSKSGVPDLVRGQDMFHLHGLGGDGIRGYSVLRYAAESIGLGLATQTFGNQFYSRGLHSAVAVKHPGVLNGKAVNLSDQAYERMRASFEQTRTGEDNWFRPLLLEEGMDIVKLSVPPEEAQFLQTRYFSVEEMARWFRITPHKLQHLLRSTFSNIENLNLTYVDESLLAWLIRWEQEISAKLLTRVGEEDLFAKHVVLGFLRGDAKTRAEYMTKRFQMGSMSPNDVREAEDENPIDGGDEYFIPANMLPMSRVTAEEEDETADQEAVPPVPPEGDMDMEEPPAVPPDQGRRGEAIRSFAPLFCDVFRRVLKAQLAAVARAAAKHDGNRAHFVEWAEGYFEDGNHVIEDGLVPIVSTLGDVLGGAVLSVGTYRQVWHAANGESLALVCGAFDRGVEALKLEHAAHVQGRDSMICQILQEAIRASLP